MKLNEIMIIKKDDTGNRLKLFQVDDDTLAQLTRIRGTLYEDNPRLKLARDIPTPEPKTELSPEMQARAEESWRLHCLTRDAGTRAAASTPEPKPMTFDTQLENDWRHSPAIRSEFISFASYAAYRRAVRDGRAKVCGRG